MGNGKEAESPAASATDASEPPANLFAAEPADAK
jgi:hypothetical protein